MKTRAVVLDHPKQIALRTLDLAPPTDTDVVVAVEHSGISAGTERLLWEGTMPFFPGMGYPLVPGYETVGRVVSAGAATPLQVGQSVFVPGANCFDGARGLFGGSASRLTVAAARVMPIAAELGENGILLALAATAHHAFAGGDTPDLIVGHGVLGRLLARLVLARRGSAPVVWDTRPDRRTGALDYHVTDRSQDTRSDYRVIVDASGDPALLDALVARLAPGGEIVLAGFYKSPLSFAFPPAFMREARIRVAAQWQPRDLAAVNALVASGDLSLDGLITHRADAAKVAEAYETAFENPACLKMVLDWRACA
jgi:bacteriochlorophyllide a dehydrogenase